MDISHANRRLIDIAVETSERADHKQFLHGCLVVRNGRILAKSFNKATAHAEVRTIMKAGVENCAGATLYVARKNYRMSKPCGPCMAFIKACLISKIVWTDWDGSIQIERI